MSEWTKVLYVYLQGVLHRWLVAHLKDNLTELLGPDVRHLVIIMNCEDGDFESCNDLYLWLKSLDDLMVEITTINAGRVDGMPLLVYLAAPANNRLATPKATFEFGILNQFVVSSERLCEEERFRLMIAAREMDEAFIRAVVIESSITALELKQYKSQATTLDAKTAMRHRIVGEVEHVPLRFPPLEGSGSFHTQIVPVSSHYFSDSGL